MEGVRESNKPQRDIICDIFVNRKSQHFLLSISMIACHVNDKNFRIRTKVSGNRSSNGRDGIYEDRFRSRGRGPVPIVMSVSLCNNLI